MITTIGLFTAYVAVFHLEDLDCGVDSHGEHLHHDGKIGHPLLTVVFVLQYFCWNSGLEASLRHLGL